MAIGIHVEIVGLRDARGRFSRYSPVLQKHARQEMSVFANNFLRTLKASAPIAKRRPRGDDEEDEFENVTPGGFRKSLYYKISRRGHITALNYYSNDPRAKFIVYKTRAHPIVAVRAKALRFWKGGNKVFAKRVFHPGTRGSDFAEKAFLKGGDEFIRGMNRAGARATIYLSGKGGD